MHEAAWILEAKAERFERSPFRVPGEAPFEFQIARWPCWCLQDLALTRYGTGPQTEKAIYNGLRFQQGGRARKERRIEGQCSSCLPRSGQALLVAKHKANHTS
jgi:hypothetical protein